MTVVKYEMIEICKANTKVSLVRVKKSHQVDKLSGLAAVAGQMRPEFPEDVDDHRLEVGGRVPQEGHDEAVTLPPYRGRVTVEKEPFDEFGQKVDINVAANL